MNDNPFDENFWTERYEKSETGWNLGSPSTPIQSYIDQLNNKQLKVLIPGAGNAYEAEHMHSSGFDQVHVLDLAKPPLAALKDRVPEFPEHHLIHGNFFNHEDSYDLILEQTFFCALNPSLRQAYADHMYKLLKPGGKLVGLLFSFPFDPEKPNPPFGGSEEEYRNLFTEFHIAIMETAHNSIEPRRGNEYFIMLQKPEL